MSQTDDDDARRHWIPKALVRSAKNELMCRGTVIIRFHAIMIIHMKQIITYNAEMRIQLTTPRNVHKADILTSLGGNTA